MAGRIPTELADETALKQLIKSDTGVMNIKPIVAFTMSKTGATFEQIGGILGVSRQRAEVIVKTFESKL